MLSQDQISLDCIQKVIGCTGVIYFLLSRCFLAQLSCHPSIIHLKHHWASHNRGGDGTICSSTPVSWDSHLSPMFSRACGREECWGHRAVKTDLWRRLLPWSLLFALWFTPYIGFGVDMPHQLVNADKTTLIKTTSSEGHSRIPIGRFFHFPFWFE